MPEPSLPTLPVAAGEFLLRPEIVFLNHGSFGACPRPVFEAFQARQRELEAQPVEFLGRRISQLLAEARAQLAGYVGTQADHLVFVPNATYGVNVVARSAPEERANIETLRSLQIPIGQLMVFRNPLNPLCASLSTSTSGSNRGSASVLKKIATARHSGMLGC